MMQLMLSALALNVKQCLVFMHISRNGLISVNEDVIIHPFLAGKYGSGLARCFRHLLCVVSTGDMANPLL